MVRVKVCGMTRADDAVLACELGATAVGFVFWEGSPRWVAPGTARAVVDALPREVTPVGVFVDSDNRTIEDTVKEVGLRAVQMHGTESAEFCVELSRRLGVEVLKAVPLRGAESVRHATGLPDSLTVLLDTHDPVKKGGTGRQVDWSLAAAVARQRRIYLAGGLSPANLVDGVVAVRPYGVDVSSGLETTPGVKDHGLMRNFFAAVAAAEHPHQGVGAPGGVGKGREAL